MDWLFEGLRYGSPPDIRALSYEDKNRTPMNRVLIYLPTFIYHRPGFSGGARHVQELTDDYEEAEYSSSVQEKADVDAILQKPWTFNKSAAEEARYYFSC